jgi:predicted RNA-binding Zn ribbon-like protein
VAVVVREVREVDGLPEGEMLFRFSSGRLCLSFCATVGERWRRSFERLRRPEDLGRWLQEAGLAQDPPPVSAELMVHARELREAIYQMVRAGMVGEEGPAADRARVNEHARQPPVAIQIGPGGARELWVATKAADAGLASIAADAVDLLTSNAIQRVRECDAADCALLFLDTSRPGRRRWCADGACGSRSRSATYRKRRTQPGEPAPAHA